MKARIITILCLIALIASQSGCPLPPVADPGEDQTVAVGTLVHFDGSGSQASEGFSIISYSWDFGAGASPSTGSGVSPSCTYSTTGAKTVTLTVMDDQQQQGSDTCTITVVDPGISPSSRFIYDGESGGTFSVTDDEGATAWGWSYDISTYQPAGNSPDCSFSPTSQRSTTVSTKWYAYPDSVCGASTGCTYNIFCDVTMNGKDFDAGPTALYVQVLETGGSTERPWVSGGVGYDNQGTPPNIWRVVTQGTLDREDSFTDMVTIYLNENSQFYDKVHAHENEHVNQWTTGFMKDYFTVDGYWNFDTQYDCKVKDLTAESEEALLQKLQYTRSSWDLGQWTAANTPENDAAMEEGAYAVSDEYAPRYLYEGECHGY